MIGFTFLINEMGGIVSNSITVCVNTASGTARAVARVVISSKWYNFSRKYVGPVQVEFPQAPITIERVLLGLGLGLVSALVWGTVITVWCWLWMKLKAKLQGKIESDNPK